MPIDYNITSALLSSGDNAAEKCVVTCSYDAENDDELSLSVGDIVTVISRDESRWWMVDLDGHTGLFPSGFMELLPDKYKVQVNIVVFIFAFAIPIRFATLLSFMKRMERSQRTRQLGMHLG